MTTHYHNPTLGVCVVLHDPDEQGGFQTGTEMNAMWAMLHQGTFTTGTILRFAGKKYMVYGTVGQPQTLVHAQERRDDH